MKVELDLESTIIIAANKLLEAKKVDIEDLQRKTIQNLADILSNHKGAVDILKRLQTSDPLINKGSD